MPVLIEKSVVILIAGAMFIMGSLNIGNSNIPEITIQHIEDSYYEMYIKDKGETFIVGINTGLEDVTDAYNYMAFINKKGERVKEWEAYWEPGLIEWEESLNKKQLEIYNKTFGDIIPHGNEGYEEIKKLVRKVTLKQRVNEKWFNKKEANHE